MKIWETYSRRRNMDKDEPIKGYAYGDTRNHMCDDFYKEEIIAYSRENLEQCLDRYLSGTDDMHMYKHTQKKGKRLYATTVMSFDTETTSIDLPDDTDPRGYKHFGFVYIWQLAIQRHVIVGRDILDFVEACDILTDKFGTDDKHRIVIWIHNIAFDFNFIRKLFKWKEAFWMKKHAPLYAVTDKNIEFRCSYLLSGRALVDISGSEEIDYWSGKPTHSSILIDQRFKKKVGDLDYSIIRTPKTKLTFKEMQYCVNDVLVMNEYITEVMNDNLLGKSYRTFGDLPYTKTGVVRDRYRQNTIYSPVNAVREQYKDLMKELTMETKEFQMAQRAFMGGFTHANAKYVEKVIEHVASADIASSYPSVIATKKFPMSKGKFVMSMTMEDYEKMEELGFLMISTIKFYGFKIKPDVPDMIAMCYKGFGTVKMKENNGRVISADEITYTLTNIDFKYFREFYMFDECVILDTYYYEADYLPYAFVDVLLSLYEDKTKLKGIEGREVEYNASKEQINSSYGMMVTDPCKVEFYYDDVADDWFRQNMTKEELIEKYNTSGSRFTSYIWGIFVTAFAREKLYRMILKMGSNYIYADTDSNKIKCFDKLKDLIEQENSVITYSIEQVAAERQIPVERFRPKDIKGKEHPLGIWELENIDDSEYKRFKTLGAKRYVYETSDKCASEGVTKDRIHLTCAGWNKKTGMDYLNSLDDPFGVFSRDLAVSSDHSGKLEHYYSNQNDITEADIEDCNGEVYHVYSPSWIYMSKGPFTLTMSDTFMMFLQQLNSTEGGIL